MRIWDIDYICWQNFFYLGHAPYLINAISKFSKIKKLSKVIIEVSQSNFSAINFYKKNTFNQIAIRENYYKLNDIEKEDTLIYEKK